MQNYNNQQMNINLRRSKTIFDQQYPNSKLDLYQKNLQPNPYSQYKQSRSSTPLSFRALSIPTQVRQYCERHQDQNTFLKFDSADEFFWLSMQKTFFLWRYKNLQSWGSIPPSPQMMLAVTFNHSIRNAQFGQIEGYQFNYSSVLKVLAIALTNKIVFFNYDREKCTFDNLKLEVGTNNQLVNDMIFSSGNLYYNGSHGSLKTVFNRPRLFKKQTRLVVKSSSLIKDTISNSILFWRVHLKSSNLIIIQKKAFFIVQKQYPNSFIASKLFYKNNKQREKLLKIFDINSNTLIKEIDETLLLDRIKIYCARTKELMEGVQIVGLFSTDNRLGLTLSCGAFVYLNGEGLLVEQVHFVPLVQSQKIIGEPIKKQMDIVQTISSLGFNNLSIFNKCGVVFVDQKCIDICNLPCNINTSKIRQIKSDGILLKQSMFEGPRQWVCMTPECVFQIKKLRIQDITLVYLQIASEQRILRKNIILEQPFLHLCNLFGTVEICVCLMEIICSSSMEILIQQSAYQNTKTEVFRLNKPQIRTLYNINNPISRQLNDVRSISLNQDIISISAEILNYIQSKDLNSELDVLWKSVLKYFNQVYFPIKSLTPSQCINSFRLVDFIKYKLQCFKKLLHIKSIEISPQASKKTEDNTLSFIGPQIGNIPPIEPSLRQKYDASTPILIQRVKVLIDKIYILLEVVLCLNLDNVSKKVMEPNIHEILTQESARDVLRLRILKEVAPGNCVLQKLCKAFPELLNQSDQIFNQFILHPNTHSNQEFSGESLVPALKTSRMTLIRDYFYKNNKLYQFAVILLQRMRFLQVQKHKIQQNKTKEGMFLAHDNAEKEDKIQQLQDNWIAVVSIFQEVLRDYIKQVSVIRSENRLELLVHYIRSLEIYLIIEFVERVLEQQALPHLIRGLKGREEKVEPKPRPLYEFK